MKLEIEMPKFVLNGWFYGGVSTTLLSAVIFLSGGKAFLLIPWAVFFFIRAISFCD